MSDVGFQFNGFFSYTSIIRIGFILASILCNTIMIKYFVKALQVLGTGKATALSAALNFILTSFAEILFIENKLNSSKCLGISLVVIGVYLLMDDNLELQKGELNENKNKNYDSSKKS